MKNIAKKLAIFILIIGMAAGDLSFGDITYTEAASSTTSKKGIQISGPQDMEQAVELGCSVVFINIRVSDLISRTDQYWGTSFSVDGKKYYMNSSTLMYYNTQFEYAKENGVEKIYVEIYSEEFEGLTDTTESSAVYHAFDTASTNGKKIVQNVFETLCKYMGSNVDYWIIGNEVNDQHQYYEMGTSSLSTYVKNYEKAMRLMYDAAIEYNSDAGVMVCLDHEWNSTEGDRFNAMELLTELASITEDDDYNWGVALHPYPEPLTSAIFWDDEDSQAYDSEDTVRITMHNLDVMTDFMQESSMKYNGKVRHIAITECAFNALDDGTEDQTLQAAAYSYAYYKAEANKYIDTFIIRSYQDASSEAEQGMCFGLIDLNGDKREVYNVLKFIDTTYGSEFTDKYLDYFDVSSWSELVSGYSDISLTKEPLGVVLNVDNTNIVNGDSIKASSTVYESSGTVEYQYQFELDDGTVMTLQDYSTTSSYSGKMSFGYSGYLIVNVTDSTEVVASDKVYIHVTDSDTYNTSGLVEVGDTLYYLDKGIIDFSYTGFADYEEVTYYVYCGMVYGTTTGLVNVDDETYYVEDSVLSDETGLVTYWGTMYYVVDGKLNSTYTGFYEDEEAEETYYVVDGIVDGYTSGIVWVGGNAYYLEDSVVSDTEIESITQWSIVQKDTLTQAIIPDTVTSINYYAFGGIETLTSVVLNDGLESIGSYAFVDCSLTSVVIPESVEFIGDYAFGYYSTDDWDYELISDFVIYGYADSAAEYYAEENDITFISVDEITVGDINLDGYTDYLDAMMALRYDAELITLTEAQTTAGDVNGDECVDALDAILILRYDAGLIESF